MSYTVTIRRLHNAKLARDELDGLTAADPSLRWVDGNTLGWLNPNRGRIYRIHVETDELWTEELRNHGSDAAFLAKLQAVAPSLDALLVGEEGEDLMTGKPPRAPGPWNFVAGGLLALVALPFLLLVLIVRLPLVLWRLRRP